MTYRWNRVLSDKHARKHRPAITSLHTYIHIHTYTYIHTYNTYYIHRLHDRLDIGWCPSNNKARTNLISRVREFKFMCIWSNPIYIQYIHLDRAINLGNNTLLFNNYYCCPRSEFKYPESNSYSELEKV